jgi:hypothetical protein
MKLKTILLLVTSVTAAHGATTVSLANFAGASSGLPIVDNTGTPIAKADSLLQVGTFIQAFADSLGGLDTRTSDQDVIDAFTATGTGRGMTFDGLFNGSIESDSDGTLGAAGTPLFALITYTPAGADPQAMVLSFGNTFPEQNAVGVASVDLGRSIALGDVVFGNTASTVPVIVDSFPPPLQNDNFKQGLTFDALNVNTLSAPILDLEDFYQSERNESVTVDATPVGGYPTDFSYQWSFNSFTYPTSLGGRAPTRTFAGNSVDNGTWKVVVTNSEGSTSHSFEYRVYVSDPAGPALELAEFYETQPGDTLSINATPVRGYPTNFTFQWYFKDTPISADQGGEERVLTLGGTSDDDGAWKVLVSNSEGSDEHVFEYRVFADEDGDGLSDYREETFLGTNPALADTDGDGLSDDQELAGPTDPILADTDNDGLLDGDELTLTLTDPVVADSDGDGLLDGEDDQDDDGLTNSAELETHNTNPLLADSDGDGLTDLKEVTLSLDPNVTTNTSDIITRLSTLQGSYNTVVVDRDSRFIDSDGDGITDAKEEELFSNPDATTTYYLKDAYDFAVDASRLAGQGDVTADPASFALTTLAAYNGIVAQKDITITSLNTTVAEKNALIVQKDEQYHELEEQSVAEAQQLNGIIETRNNTISLSTTTIASLNETITQKEAAYVTVVGERDARPTLAAYNTAVAESRVAGQSEVTSAPASYNLITQTSYNAVVAERDARPTAEQLATVEAERDARFVDTDEDGITDVKETQLETDSTEETTFYLQDAYDSAVDASRLAGQGDVTSAPASYSLVTQGAYDAAELAAAAKLAAAAAAAAAAADTAAAKLAAAADELAAASAAVELAAAAAADTADTAELAASAAADTAELAATAAADTAAAAAAELAVAVAYLDSLRDQEDRAGVAAAGSKKKAELTAAADDELAAAIAAAELVVAARADASVAAELAAVAAGADAAAARAELAELAARAELAELAAAAATDTAAGTKLALEAAIADAELAASAAASAAAAAVATARTAGQGDVTSDPASYSLVTQVSYDTVVAERDARPTQVSYDALAAERDARFVDTDEDGLTDVKEIELETNLAVETSFYLQGAYDNAVAASNLLGRQAGRSDVTGNPGSFNLTTVGAYNTVVAERDARFTEDQIRTMLVDHTVGLNEAGNMQVKIGFIQSADLNTYTPFTVIPDSLSVVDGKICMEFPPSDDENFFFRFRIE